MRWMGMVCFVFLVGSCTPSKYLERKNVQLSKPKIIVSNVFFDAGTKIRVGATAEGAGFEYVLSDGERKMYKGPITVDKSSVITVQAKGGGYISSELSTLEVIKIPSRKNNQVSSMRKLDEKYGVEGLDILLDVQKGSTDFKKGWLGYLGGVVDFTVNFDEREVEEIIVSTLRNHDAWIFSPQRINIYQNEKLICSHQLSDGIEKQKNAPVFTKITFEKIVASSLKIEIITHQSIPSWHPGHGEKPWVFIDEILIY